MWKFLEIRYMLSELWVYWGHTIYTCAVSSVMAYKLGSSPTLDGDKLAMFAQQVEGNLEYMFLGSYSLWEICMYTSDDVTLFLLKFFLEEKNLYFPMLCNLHESSNIIEITTMNRVSWNADLPLDMPHRQLVFVSITVFCKFPQESAEPGQCLPLNTAHRLRLHLYDS